MEYKIVSAPSTRVLQNRVNELFFEGWQLQGGITTMPSTGTWQPSCHQAMIRDDVKAYQKKELKKDD